jgi:hypothetical protein
MSRHQNIEKPTHDASTAPRAKFLQTRPLQSAHETSMQQPEQQAAQLQEEQESGSKGFDLTQMSAFASGSGSLPNSASSPSDAGTEQPLQAKLTIGQPNDKYELEADRVADAVMRTFSTSGERRSPHPQPQIARLQPRPLQRQNMEAAQAAPMSPNVSHPTPRLSNLHVLQQQASLQRQKDTSTGTANPDLEQSIQQKRGRGQPLGDSVRQPLEQAFGGTDFSGVNIHTDAQSDKLNQAIQAKAFTTGQDIFFRQGAYNPGTQSGQKLIAHELTHVVQQQPGLKRQPQVSGRLSELHHISGQKLQRVEVQEHSPLSIQCNYAALSGMAKARVDQQSEEKYAEKTQEFEFKMSPKIMTHARTNQIVDVLLARVKRIVDAWAVATGRDQGETYEREFGWAGGDEYYGAFEMTAQNIRQVFSDKTQPMRKKLKIVYNAVRNNNLSKWLKLAANEIDRAAKGKKARAWKIKTATQNVVKKKDDQGRVKSLVKGRAEKETVNVGFAQQSGLESWLTDDQVQGFARTFQGEKKTEHDRSKRDVFGHDRFSEVMGWQQATRKANRERRGGGSSGLALAEQRTLSTADVPDLTDEEIDFMYKRQGRPQPDATERNRFRTDPNAKVMWSQGGEYFNIQLDSDSAKAAAKVKARMEAGISGSTDLMLHAMQNLGLSNPSLMKGMRLALAGWMMANRDHSFYEIYKAAESYGIPFDIDENDPGKEYESATNLAPMTRDDFEDTLPERKFPKYFLSAAYKDTLADTLPQANQDQNHFKASLKTQGIPDSIVNTLDERATAELSRLSEVVASQTIEAGDRYWKKQQSIRRIKQHRSFIYLGNNLGEPTAESILDALIKTHHSGKGVAPDNNNTLNTLADAGVPRVILEVLSQQQITAIEAARGVLMQAKINPQTRQLDFTDFNKAIIKVRLNNNTQSSVIRAVLIQTYYGNVSLSEAEKYQADAARMMAGHEESGAKKLTAAQLDTLQAPTSSGGTQISDQNYWASQAARSKLSTNLSIVVDSFLKRMNDPEKTRIRNAIFTQYNNDQEFINTFNDVEREEGFSVAVTSFAGNNFLEREVLPADAQDALTGLKGLHDKELGAIFQYTTALYKPIVNSANSFNTADFADSDLNRVEWGSPLATLKYTGPMMQALSSGLAKLPVYPGKVYRLVTTRSPIMTQNLQARQQYAANYKAGTLEMANYPMSAAKTLNSQFAKTNYNNPTFSVVYEIENVKSGRDIQYVSDKVNEEEVLFPPGSRLRVIAAYPNNPNDPNDTHIWVRLEEV